MLQETNASGWASFVELLHAAESVGFPVPNIAGEVQRRIEPIVLYLAFCLVLVPGAVGSLHQYRGESGASPSLVADT